MGYSDLTFLVTFVPALSGDGYVACSPIQLLKLPSHASELGEYLLQAERASGARQCKRDVFRYLMTGLQDRGYELGSTKVFISTEAHSR